MTSDISRLQEHSQPTTSLSPLALAASVSGQSEFYKYGAVGSLLGAAGVTFASTRSSWFKALPMAPVKVGIVAMTGLGLGWYAGEQRVLQIAQGKVNTNGEWLDNAVEQEWNDWINDNKYGLLGGAWFTSIVGMMAYFRSKPSKLMFWQQLVNARIAAQLGAILGIAALSTWSASYQVKPTGWRAELLELQKRDQEQERQIQSSRL